MSHHLGTQTHTLEQLLYQPPSHMNQRYIMFLEFNITHLKVVILQKLFLTTIQLQNVITLIHIH